MVVSDLTEKLYCEDEQGLFIYNDRINRLKLNNDEKEQLLTFLSNNNIEIRLRERSTENFNYGENSNPSTPKIADIRYREDGTVAYANFSKLDEYLEEEFLPFVLNQEVKIDEIGNRSLGEASVRLWEIVHRNFCDLEFEYIMNYLKERNIFVYGSNKFLCGEFDNYRYTPYEVGRFNVKNSDYSDNLDNITKYKETCDKKYRDDLVIKNMPLILKLSSGYAQASGMAREELVGYACEGLIEAIEKFDPSKDIFYKFVEFYIRKSLTTGVAEIQGFRRNKFYTDFIRTKKEVENDYLEKLEDNIDLLDIVLERMADHGDIDIKNISLNKARVLIQMPMDIEECSDTLELSDDNSLDYKIAKKFIYEALDSELCRMNYKEDYVIRHHYGIGCQEQTQSEISADFNVTLAMISLIEKNALRNFRRSAGLKTLKDLYEMIDYSHYNSNKIVRERKNTKIKK